MQRVMFLLLVGAVALMETAAPTVAQEAAPHTVTSAMDPGDGTCDTTCTLRDAILIANATPGPDRIEFAVGEGPVTLHLSQPLPFLEDPGTVIDATTQPGYDGRPLIMLDGSGAELASGIVSVAADMEILGLAVGNFPRYGLAVIGEEADANRFLSNWVGVALDGRTAAPNQLSGIAVLAGADDALVGDACSGCGNLVAGNSVAQRTGHGILIGGLGTVGARLRGNVVGLDAAGNALPNDDGILVVDGAHATIGGREAGAGNVVSGNRVAGIEVRDTTLLTIRIEGNHVGLDGTGARAVANDVGIFINGDAAQVHVGAATAAAANVISGNRVGIAVEQRASAIVIHGNVIGLDAGGRVAVPNTEDGISVVAGARDVQIGGSAAGEGNWIAGNGNAIVIADVPTTDVRVEGNIIGLTLDGDEAAPNERGITVQQAADIVIGDVGPTAGNVIGATIGSAILLDGARRAVIRGNHIGLRADGSAAGNGVGITIQGGTVDALVQENHIGGNVGPGIEVLGENTQRNRLTRNIFLTNGGTGIDLGGNGVTPNDPDDADRGPHGLLNTPIITEVSHDGVVTTVRGTGEPRSRVEVYRISPPRPPFADPHPSGFGAGAELLGVARVDADGAWQMALGTNPATPMTALTVDAAGNTSEFAPNFFPVPPLLLSAGFTPAGWFGPPTSAADAFAPLEGRLVAAFRFSAARQAWEVARPALPIVSSLRELLPGDALWVLLDDGPRIAWTQPAAEAGSRTVALQAGLNFETWTGLTTAVADALSAIGERVETAFRWDGLIRRFELIWPILPLLGASTDLSPHDILWLRMRETALWTQPVR